MASKKRYTTLASSFPCTRSQLLKAFTTKLPNKANYFPPISNKIKNQSGSILYTGSATLRRHLECIGGCTDTNRVTWLGEYGSVQ